ncbi:MULTISPECIES: ROK family protein [unclassified Iodidimonas]|jgi:fructokinase|uniref:ROK family protein n=1 Tax=unclassified Iodidimonas TaxID=2626145 RepID=UPI002482D70D|nr:MULTISPECIES: ROK family protein [unclassified Iodidimonas]
MTMHIGIDLGGTKIEIAALSHDGEELLRTRRPAPSKNYEETVRAIVDLIGEVQHTLGRPGTVGIGTPGAVSRKTGLIKNAYATALNDKPFKSDLETALGRPIKIANDGNCFALSEAIDGAGKGAEIVFGVIVGTGCGGGLVIDQHVIEGANSIAAEWGHNPLPSPDEHELQGFSYYQGGENNIEAYLCGAGLVHDHLRSTGESLTAPEIAAADTPQKEQTMQRYERRMAKALGSLINIIDPHVIVLGGGLSNIDRLYENVPKYWGEYIFSDRVETQFKRNVHGDSSGVRGAAWLWVDH